MNQINKVKEKTLPNVLFLYSYNLFVRVFLLFYFICGGKMQRQRFFYFFNYGGLYAFPLQLSDQNPGGRKLGLGI